MRVSRASLRGRLSAAGLGLALLANAAAAAAAPERLLHVDFDGQHCPSGSRSHVPGVAARGRALLLPAGEQCVFPARGHIRSEAGTLSFWVQPHAWSDGEGRNQVFFHWAGWVDGRRFQLYVDSPARPGVVRLALGFGRHGDPRQQHFQIFAPARWQAGVWQRIDVTWDGGEIVLYANGVEGQRLSLESVRLPAPDGMQLSLTPRAAQGPSDATAIDDVEIWDAAFPAARIARRYEAATTPPLARPLLRAPRFAHAPAIDRTLDDPIWERATRVPLLTDSETGATPLSFPHVGLGWTEAGLHVAFDAPLTDSADAIELSLASERGRARTWRVDAARAEATAPEGPEGAVLAMRTEPGRWRVALQLPLGAVAIPEQRLRLALRHLPAASGTLAAGAAWSEAEVVLGSEGAGVQVVAGPELGVGGLRLAFTGPIPVRAEVDVAGGGGEVWHRTLASGRRLEVAAAGLPPKGVLRIDVADGHPWVRLESRLGRIEPPGLARIPDVTTRSLAVELDLGWLDGSWLDAAAAGALAVRLGDRGPAGLEWHDVVPDRAHRARVLLSNGLAAGEHELALEIRDRTRTVRLEEGFTVPPLPWLGDGAPESAEVLEPWTPLAWEGPATVRVWGRRYAFDGPLLAEASAAGGRILRAPMRLVLRTRDVDAPLRVTEASLLSSTPGRAERSGRGVFEGTGISLSWTSSLEYDGLVVSSFTLQSVAPGVRVEGLRLEVPLEPRIARILRGTQQGSTIRRGRVPWDGRRFEAAFEPFLWLTGETDGFLVFSESAANWVGAERRGAVSVRGGPDAALVLRLIGEPVTLPGPLSYSLGFQATPVKPELPRARAWNFGVGGTRTPRQTVITHYAGYARADGLWELVRPNAVARRDAEFAESGARPFYYAATSATPDHLPEFRLFERLWRSAWAYSYGGQAAPGNVFRPAVPAHRNAAVCPADGTFQARMLHDAEALLAAGALGLYTDTDEVFADDNARHGCGYRDAFGRVGVTWGILAKRRFAKRLAALLREAGGERRYWMSHAHTRLVPPVHGFADFFLPGEELTNALGRTPWLYSDGIDDEAWRVEYRGASSGVVHVLLPEFGRGSGDPGHLETRQPTESLLAQAAVNDVNVASAYASPEAVGEYWRLREELRLIDAEFVGHWQADCPVRARSPEARASVYRTRNGPVLVVATRSSEAVRVEVDLDLAALGLRGASEAFDVRGGRREPIERGRLAVSLAPRTYTFVTFGPHQRSPK